MSEPSSSKQDARAKGAARLLQRRVRRACEACRLRKRKCDGSMPCKMCRQNNYACYYEARATRNGAHASNEASAEHSPTDVEQELSDKKSPLARHEGEFAAMTPAEVMSSETFSRVLGTKLAPMHASKSHVFAFNVGLRSTPFIRHSTQPTHKLIPLETMTRWSNAYFEKVHSLFGFLNRHTVELLCEQHWKALGDTPQPDIDAILCGVACIGCIFSDYDKADIAELLAENAKLSLAAFVEVEPTVDVIAGWLMRTLYLRFTKNPYCAWMCAVTAMHLSEAIGLHRDAQLTAVGNPDVAGENIQFRRRVFWFTRQLNVWTSLEYGRSWVELKNTTCKRPTFTPENPMAEILTFFDISQCLDSDGTTIAREFENAVLKLYEMKVFHDASQLCRSIICLSIYRRLWIMNPHKSSEIAHYVISICNEGLRAVDRCVNSSSPWWHLAALPLGFLCVLIVMDSKESLAEVSNVVSVLHKVQQRFDTISTRGAVNYARHLIRFLRERKQCDTMVLDAAMEISVTKAAQQPQKTPPASKTCTPNEPSAAPLASHTWDQEYNFDDFNWENINWDLFLNQSNPNFEACCWY